MAATFDCPECGAPINFDPDPGDKTILCSYCGETVIIPADLRIPMPTPRYEPLETKPQGRNWGAIGSVVFAVLVVGFLAVQALTPTPPVVMPSDSQISAIVAEQSATETAQSQATDDAQSATETQAAAEAKSTAQALIPIVAQEQEWPVLLNDNFQDLSNAWESGDVRENNLVGKREIVNGKYIWNVTTTASAFYSSFPNASDQTDFFASMDIKYISMPDDPSADAGFILRFNNTEQNWYYFSVNQFGQYYFGWYDGQAWHSLIPETDSTGFQRGETNQIAVGVRGTQFIFLINGQVVDTFNNGNLKSGLIGVGVNLPQADQKANFEITNFTVRTPTPKK